MLLVYEAANQDPSFYDAPAAFRLDRNANDDVAYGYGPHRCVGIHFARAELRIATTALLARSDWLTLRCCPIVAPSRR